MALTRALPGLPPLNIGVAISLPEVFAAYTQKGPRAIGRGHKIGPLSVGKSADFIVLYRDILALPITDVAATEVVQTWFMGRQVFKAH
jgi:predicted amidohydrolase YtcJ